MNQVNKVYYNQLVTIFLIAILTGSFLIQDYTTTYLSMSVLLFWVFVRYSDLNIKVVTGFFFAYYFIPLPNISTYRGTIVYSTLLLYTLMLLLGILPLLFKFKLKKKIYKIKKVSINSNFRSVVSIHLLTVYIILFFVYFKYGFVIINQELRFKIPTVLSYLIKSSIYIPLFSVFFNRGSFNKSIILKYILLPLTPAIMIGSRGTVILVLLSLAILLVIGKMELGDNFKLKTSVIWKQHKKHVYRIVAGALAILQIFYYSRRFFSDKLLSNMGVIRKFFHSESPLYLIILPLYASFRETIGLANVIVKNDYHNMETEYPLFVAELYTIFPGKQPAPGQIIGSFVGKNLDGGLTPNLLGGLYIDFGVYAIFGCMIFIFIINFFYKKAIFNEYYKILYVVSLTQFFHLFHRGFLKPEYVMAYIIIFFYFFILRIKDENSTHSLSIAS